jgi:hypothetical protein
MIIRQRKRTNGSMALGESNNEIVQATTRIIKLHLDQNDSF